MKTYDLGYMTESAAKRIEKALDGKTFMSFRIDLGRGPGGWDVHLSSDYEASDADILGMALNVLAGADNA